MNRIISSEHLSEDVLIDKSLRPKTLEYFTGQKEMCSNLQVFINAAKTRGEALDHVLLFGPPGLGKTTIAQIIANEMNVSIKTTSGPILTKPGDLAAIMTNIGEKDILFIDEIHRMTPAVEEMLYPAMEDFKIDIMIGEGQSAKSLRLDIPPLTVIGATTRLGLLSQPLRERFGIPLRFNFYTTEELSFIVQRNANLLGFEIDESAAFEISKRSRGTPRVAYRLLRRIRDFASIEGAKTITHRLTTSSLDKLNVDLMGLDSEDKKYICAIKNLFNGGPVGIETLAAALCDSASTIEEIIEPYLIQQGLIQKTPRGRILTALGNNSAE